jgi:hypothetical protein
MSIVYYAKISPTYDVIMFGSIEEGHEILSDPDVIVLPEMYDYRKHYFTEFGLQTYSELQMAAKAAVPSAPENVDAEVLSDETTNNYSRSGFKWNNATMAWGSFITTPARLARKKQILINRVQALRDQAYDNYFLFDGKQIKLSIGIRAEIASLSDYVALNNALPAWFPNYWPALDGSVIAVLTVVKWKSFVDAYGQTIFKYREYVQTLMVNIVAATTLEDLEPYNIISLPIPEDLP